VNSTLFLFATLSITQTAIAQCQDVYYGPTVYGPPIVCAPADYNNIHYSGTVYSKKYVTAVMDDGQRMSVPVINGLLPSVNYRRLASGGMQRDFWYDEGFKYGGEAVVEYGTNDKKKAVQPPKASYSEDLPLSKKAGIREESSFDENPPKKTTPPARVREDDEELPPPKKVQMPDPKIQQLQDSIGELQKTVVELREAVKKQQAPVVPEPKKVEAPSPMKKPSEFDKEPK
jgi:hypothetical protein